MINRTLVLALSILALPAAQAQDTLRLENPSFEDEFPRAGEVPAGWVNRGSAGETPPDIQPGQFNVYWPPEDGLTYMSLVVRDNNTWEGLGQKLNGRLQKDSAYRFSVALARSAQFLSRSRLTNDPVAFGMSCVLQVWGANTATGQRELLAVSPPVPHSRWQRYEFELLPLEGSYDEIQLVAYYKENVVKAYNGNLLLDNCSAIVRK
jgi:hypothetical protein